MKEVLEKVDPRAENVVFFMEAVGADGEFQKQVDRANRGEITYREVFLNSLLAQNIGVDNPEEEYPLLKSMSGPKSGRQISDLLILQKMFKDNPNLEYWMAEANLGLSAMRDHMEFFLSRSHEFDKLRMELQKRGKNLVVISEDSVELIKEIGANFEFTEEDRPPEDLESYVFEEIHEEVLRALVGIARDEVNAKLLREKVSKLTGKTEIFSHFGTLHKYLPIALTNEKFVPSTNHAPFIEYPVAVYEEIIVFAEEKGISFMDLIRNRDLVTELTNKFITENELIIYMGIYSLLVSSHCTFKQKFSYYKTVKEYVEGIPEHQRIENVRRWLEEELQRRGSIGISKIQN